eukprot:TRINITY_DN2020_c0_g2_i1.p2 TRINITY_DN2020_c0_g2~~TRINITY_DN2020_c0_g2_i1.p2  ORF type:complete len:109 (+),score=20.37 TRINITY_DN2020_c0_g2_i1:16-342(+)
MQNIFIETLFIIKQHKQKTDNITQFSINKAKVLIMKEYPIIIITHIIRKENLSILLIHIIKHILIMLLILTTAIIKIQIIVGEDQIVQMEEEENQGIISSTNSSTIMN